MYLILHLVYNLKSQVSFMLILMFITQIGLAYIMQEDKRWMEKIKILLAQGEM